jgi:hypothetical protein
MNREQTKALVSVGIDNLTTIRDLGYELHDTHENRLEGVITHWDCVVAYANGAELEYNCGTNKWYSNSSPDFYSETKYRIAKPKPHPVFGYAMINAPRYGNRYWYINEVSRTGEDFIVKSYIWNGGDIDFGSLVRGNVFATETLAEMQVGWLKERLALVKGV